MTPRQVLEDQLREQMEAAHRQYRVAVEATRTLTELSKDVPNPDGTLMRSGAVEAHYLKEYVEALRRFTDVLVRGVDVLERKRPGAETGEQSRERTA